MRPAPYTRGGKAPAIACKAANLRRMRFLCAARKKITIETESRRKTHLRRRGERHKKSPPQKAGGRGVKLEGKGGAGGGEKFAKCKPIRT